MSPSDPPRNYGKRLDPHEPRFPSGVVWGSVTAGSLYLLLVSFRMTDVGTETARQILGALVLNPVWFPVGVLVGFFVVAVVVVTVVWVVTAALTVPVGLGVGSLLRRADDEMLHPESPSRGTLYWWTGFGTGIVLTYVALGFSEPVAAVAGGDGAVGLGGTIGGFFGAVFGWAIGVTMGVSYGASQVVGEWDYWKPWLFLEAGLDLRLLSLSEAEIERYREEAPSAGSHEPGDTGVSRRKRS